MARPTNLIVCLVPRLSSRRKALDTYPKVNLVEESLGTRLLLLSYIPKNTSQFYLILGPFCLPLLGIMNSFCSLAICHLYPCECGQLVTLFHFDNQKIHTNKSIKKFQKNFKRCRDEVPKSKQTRCRDSLNTKLNVHSPIPTSFSHVNCTIHRICKQITKRMVLCMTSTCTSYSQ